MQKLQPMYDRVLLRLADPSEKTDGGIFIPGGAGPSVPVQATVVAVGSGLICQDGTVLPLLVQVGDTVLVPPTAGAEVKLNGEKLRLVREGELLGVLRGADAPAKPAARTSDTVPC